MAPLGTIALSPGIAEILSQVNFAWDFFWKKKKIKIKSDWKQENLIK